LTLEKFILSVGARSSAPGGGSVAAVLAALGCALSSMIGQMTFGKRQFESVDSIVRSLIPPLHSAMVKAIPMIDADTDAFNDYMTALKLPQENDAGKVFREEAMERALHKAINVPLSLARHVNSVWHYLTELAKVGNINCKSDLQVRWYRVLGIIKTGAE